MVGLMPGYIALGVLLIAAMRLGQKKLTLRLVKVR